MGNTNSTGWTFAQVPIWLLCNSDISDGSKVLFAYLKYRQGTDAACWPSRETVAVDIGVSTGTVTRRLKELEDLGYIKRHFRDGSTTLYELAADPQGERERWESAQDARRAEKEKRNSIPCLKMSSPPAQKCVDTLLKNEQHDDNQERESINDKKHDTPSACANAQSSLVTYSDWEKKIREATNRTAALREMIETLYPYLQERDMPAYGRIGKSAKNVGGAGRLCQIIWDAARYEPQGDVCSYFESMAKGNGGNGSNKRNSKGSGVVRDEKGRVHNDPTPEEAERLRRLFAEHKQRQLEAASAV